MSRWPLLTVAVMCALAGAVTGCGGQSGSASSGDTPVSSDDSAQPPASGRGQDGTVSGRVTAADGTPLAECGIVPEATFQPVPPIPEIGVVADEEGRYRWHLPAGTYTVTAYCGGTDDGDIQRTGTATDVVVTSDTETTADITVT